jgi:DNA repair protein SbcC/Rad50
MKPHFIQLTNFMSHRTLRVDFDSPVIVVSGPNGAGKSAILEAMTFALWGKCRVGLDEVVRRGASGALVRLSFSVGGSTYYIARSRHLNGSGTSELQFAVDVDGDMEALTCHTIRDTQAQIDKVIGFSYDLFVSTSVVMQGDASRFTESRPADRKTLLAEMLGLEEYQRLEKLARLRLNEVSSSVSQNQAKQDILLSGLQDEEELKEEEHYIAESIKTGKLEIELLEMEIGQLEEGIRELKELGKIEERLTGILKRREQIEGTIKHLQRLLSRKDWYSEQKNRRDELLERANIYAEQASKFSQASALLMEIANQVAVLKAAAEDAEGHILSAKKLEADLEVAGESLESIRNERLEVVAVIEDKREQLGLLQDREIYLLQAEAAVENDNRKVAISLEMVTGQATCPTCLQPIPDTTELVGRLEAEMREYDEKNANIREDLDVVCKAIGEFVDAIALLKEKEAELDKELKRRGDRVVELENHIRLLRGLYSSGQEAARKLADGDYAHEQRELLGSIGDYQYDREEADRVSAELKTLDGIQKQWEDALYQQSSLAEKELALTQLTVDAVALSDEAAEYRTRLDGFEYTVHGAEEEIVATNVQLDKIKSLVSQYTSDLATVREKIAEQGRVRQSLKEIEAEGKELEESHQITKTLVDASGKTGAQALIIEAALPVIEQDANTYLSVLSGDSMNLLLESQKIGKTTGSASETLDIMVFHNGYQAQIEALSGGERWRADLALRLAIARSLARRSGTQIKFLAIDEGFGSQDAEGQESILSLLNGLREFELLFVITHLPQITNYIKEWGKVVELGGKG